MEVEVREKVQTRCGADRVRGSTPFVPSSFEHQAAFSPAARLRLLPGQFLTLAALSRECQFDETVTSAAAQDPYLMRRTEQIQSGGGIINPAFTSDHLADKSKLRWRRKSFSRLKVIFLHEGFVFFLIVCGLYYPRFKENKHNMRQYLNNNK